MNTTDKLNEYTKVERPFIEQLKRMGWDHIQGSIDDPAITLRESFRDVLLRDRLKQAIRNINPDESGKPWLDDHRIEDAIRQLERLEAHKLMEANQNAMNRLLLGVPVEGDPKHHQGREVTLQFIDFQHPEQNDFLAINQFRMDIPGGKTFIIPDIVLFINGIPVVVAECKNPEIQHPMENAIDQLLRYSNTRDWIESDEGNERLFHYNIFMIATYYYKARAGTIAAQPEHYMEWKDTSPIPMAEVCRELETEKPASQQILIAGMLRKENLTDLVRNFTLFKQESGKTIKIVARYQQFRAVHRTIDRLSRGQTKKQHGEHDQRGGVIWHTQGSGKSLTMVFLVRKMRTLPYLRQFKVIIVTDRTDLQDQLSETAALTGESVRIATKTRLLQKILKEKGADLVFAMIQKYQVRDDQGAEIFKLKRTFYPESRAKEGEDAHEYGYASEKGKLYGMLTLKSAPFPLLNTSEEILVLVDEAHRSQSSDLHVNLMTALPNCTKIGFTGTPIIVGKRKRTHEIFGDYIDRYTIKESEADGATVPILYEGHTTEASVSEGQTLDGLFEDMFKERTPEELEAIKKKYATKGNVLEARKMIAAKADNILRHYVDNILPNGFKAQLVTVSRRAAVRYQKAFASALEKLISELENLDPALILMDEDTLEEQAPETQFSLRAHARLDIIRNLEFAAVISSGTNDDAVWKQWTDKEKQKIHRDRFKTPLIHSEPEKQDGLAFLIVKSMLLTGFDAPMEQVLYIDRHISGHELLQAIARVNRVSSGKSHGLVVDYYGVGHHLKEALAIYTNEDVEGALTHIRDELPRLRDRHRRCLAVFHKRGIPDIADVDACVDILRNEEIRAEFVVKLRMFLETLDLIMPRAEARPFLRDAKILGFIAKSAANLYRDKKLNILGARQKVRKLIDDHILARGTDPKILPISILHEDFEKAVDQKTSSKAKASEMEHALRYHIRKHFDEDPAHYKKLSEQLDTILKSLKGQWDQLEKALREFVRKAKKARQKDDTGLDPQTQAPFFDVILEEMEDAGNTPDEEQKNRVIPLTVEIADHISQEIRAVDFWRNSQSRNVLRGWLIRFLDDNNLMPFDKIEKAADRLMDLAKARHAKLAK